MYQIFFRNGRTIANIVTIYSIAASMENNAPATEPAFAIAITTARRHHAVTSSFAADAIERIPVWVFVIFRSWIILASTGKAVILMEIPTNSANGKKAI